MQALPFIILGVGLTAGIALIAGACAVAKNAWALFILIPAIIAVVVVVLLKNRDDSSYEESIITSDALVFFLLLCLVSVFGIPSVLYHIGRISKVGSLIMDIIGSVAVIAGCVCVQFIGGSNDFSSI